MLSGETAAFHVGGTGEFTAANIDTLKAVGTSTGGFRTGSTIGLDTTNAAGGNFTYTSTIANPNAGANVLGLAKLGGNTLTLTRASTYTGGTTVNAGTLLANNTTGSATGTGAVSVGNGLLAAALRDATLSPGASIGTLATGRSASPPAPPTRSNSTARPSPLPTSPTSSAPSASAPAPRRSMRRTRPARSARGSGTS